MSLATEAKYLYKYSRKLEANKKKIDNMVKKVQKLSKGQNQTKVNNAKKKHHNLVNDHKLILKNIRHHYRKFYVYIHKAHK